MNNSYYGSSGVPSSNFYNVQGSNVQNGSDERFIGSGFVFPFLLGGVTGAAIAPAFWRPPYNRPYSYGPYYGPYYGSYYGGYRYF